MTIHDTWPTGFKTKHDMALVMDGGQLWLVWTDLHGSVRSAWSAPPPSGKYVWTQLSGALAENITTGPGVVPGYGGYFGSGLVMAFANLSGQIQVIHWDTGNIADSVTLGDTTTVRPSVAWWDRRLWLAWTGNDGRLNTLNATQKLAFQDRRSYSDKALRSPGLASDDIHLVIGWCGADPEHHQNFAEVHLGAEELQNKITFVYNYTVTGISVSFHEVIYALWAPTNPMRICSLRNPWHTHDFQEDALTSSEVTPMYARGNVAYLQDGEIWVGRY